MLLLWPTLWALGGLAGRPAAVDPAVFVAGVWLMRAAGCVVNDYADRKFDGHVKRTARRPLPSGDVTEKEARTLFIVLVLLFPVGAHPQHHDHSAVGGGAGAGVGLSVYEALHSSAAGGAGRGLWLVDPDGLLGRQRIAAAELLADVPRQYSVGGGLRYQYAMVDRDDDVKIGIKSTAILFGETIV